MPASFLVKRSKRMSLPPANALSLDDEIPLSHHTYGETLFYDDRDAITPTATSRLSSTKPDFDPDTMVGVYDIITSENIHIARAALVKLRQKMIADEQPLTPATEESSNHNASAGTNGVALPVEILDARNGSKQIRKRKSDGSTLNDGDVKKQRPKISSLVASSMGLNSLSTQMIVRATSDFLSRYGSFSFDFSVSLSATEKASFNDHFSQQRAVFLALKRLNPRDVAIKPTELYDLMHAQHLVTFKYGERERYEQLMLWEGLFAMIVNEKNSSPDDPRKQGIHRITLAIQELLRKSFSIGAIKLDNFGSKGPRFYYIH
ncbi:hypothetical protein SeLEV6574_g05084 [Synchytrium endobioticum]|uniref:Uncharacterized protein n=1 Tax=Synchytrium endobioticum TaxID=286115 RepID=A0A507CW99_9FUNG|nr:hypothetical protein SeLEV6574_g05084 [Synchytrium endobioticum]